MECQHAYPDPCLYFLLQIIFLNLFDKISQSHLVPCINHVPKVHVRGTCSSPVSIAQTQLSPSMSILEDTEDMEPQTIDKHSRKESFKRATAVAGVLAPALQRVMLSGERI